MSLLNAQSCGILGNPGLSRWQEGLGGEHSVRESARPLPHQHPVPAAWKQVAMTDKLSWAFSDKKWWKCVY